MPLNQWIPDASPGEIAARMLALEQSATILRKRPDPEDIGQVYFLRCSVSGLIKIGTTGPRKSHLRARLANLQACSGPTQVCIRVLPRVRRSLEKRLHRHFAAARDHGEWFRPSVQLRRALRLSDWDLLRLLDGKKPLRGAARAERIAAEMYKRLPDGTFVPR